MLLKIAFKKLLARLGWTINGTDLYGTFLLTTWWKNWTNNLVEKFNWLEQSVVQIGCNIGCNNWAPKLSRQMGGKFGEKNWMNTLVEHLFWKFGDNWGEKLSGKFGRINGFKNALKMEWEKLSVQCIVDNSSEFIEEVLAFRNLWKKPWCNSVWGVGHFARLLLCLTPPE